MRKTILRIFSACAACVIVAALLLGVGGDWAKRIKTSARKAGIMRSCEGYSVSRTSDSAIYYTEGDAEYARIAEGIISTYLPVLCADFELEPIPDVTLVIYPSGGEMHKAIGFSARTGKPAPMGAYSAGIITVLSPSYWAETKDGQSASDYFLSNGPVLHELAHLVLDKKTNGNYKEWFSEGTALFYENRYTGYEIKGVDTPVSYGELSSGFKYLNERDGYRRSYEIIKGIYDIGGNKALKKIYGRLERGDSLDSALRKVLGAYYFALDNL